MSKNSLSRYSHSSLSKPINHKNINKMIDASLKKLNNMKLENQAGIDQLQEMNVELAGLKDKCKEMLDKINSTLEFKKSILEFLSTESIYVTLDVEQSQVKKIQSDIDVVLTLCGLNLEGQPVSEKEQKDHDLIVLYFKQYYLLPYIIAKLEKNPKSLPWAIDACEMLYEKVKSRIKLPTMEDYNKYEACKRLKHKKQALAEILKEGHEVTKMMEDILFKNRQDIDSLKRLQAVAIKNKK